MEDNLASTILASALNDINEIIKASENCEWTLQRTKIPGENELFLNNARIARLTNGSSVTANESALELNNSYAISTETFPERLYSLVKQLQSCVRELRQSDNTSHIIPLEFEDFTHRLLNRINGLHQKQFEVHECSPVELLSDSTLANTPDEHHNLNARFDSAACTLSICSSGSLALQPNGGNINPNDESLKARLVQLQKQVKAQSLRITELEQNREQPFRATLDNMARLDKIDLLAELSKQQLKIANLEQAKNDLEVELLKLQNRIVELSSYVQKDASGGMCDQTRSHLSPETSCANGLSSHPYSSNQTLHCLQLPVGIDPYDTNAVSHVVINDTSDGSHTLFGNPQPTLSTSRQVIVSPTSSVYSSRNLTETYMPPFSSTSYSKGPHTTSFLTSGQYKSISLHELRHHKVEPHDQYPLFHTPCSGHVTESNNTLSPADSVYSPVYTSLHNDSSKQLPPQYGSDYHRQAYLSNRARSPPIIKTDQARALSPRSPVYTSKQEIRPFPVFSGKAATLSPLMRRAKTPTGRLDTAVQHTSMSRPSKPSAADLDQNTSGSAWDIDRYRRQRVSLAVVFSFPSWCHMQSMAPNIVEIVLRPLKITPPKSNQILASSTCSEIDQVVIISFYATFVFSISVTGTLSSFCWLLTHNMRKREGSVDCTTLTNSKNQLYDSSFGRSNSLRLSGSAKQPTSLTYPVAVVEPAVRLREKHILPPSSLSFPIIPARQSVPNMSSSSSQTVWINNPPTDFFSTVASVCGTPVKDSRLRALATSLEQMDCVDFIHWDKDMVSAWLYELGFGYAVSSTRRWLHQGSDLVRASRKEVEHEMGIRNPLHLKKLFLHLQLRTKEPVLMFPGFPIVHMQIPSYFNVAAWLDDMGLGTYTTAFDVAAVNALVLNNLTLDDLEALKITSELHLLSLRRGIQILRRVNFDLKALFRGPPIVTNSNWLNADDLDGIDQDDVTSGVFAGSTLQSNIMTQSFTTSITEACNQDDSTTSVHPKSQINFTNLNVCDICRWTQYRVMAWLNFIELPEYAPDLAGSGVHGALIVLEDRVTPDLLANILHIPSSKTLVRRHLTSKFAELVGEEIWQRKQAVMNDPDVVALTQHSRIKCSRKRRLFRSYWKRKGSEVEEELVCPLDIDTPDDILNIDATFSDVTQSDNTSLQPSELRETDL
ncbi:hypothetical protein EG68_01328 [Paragonimus skrjabini miyazakii]|uniref:SAM domain-containing protein n=1 Tax=Paragonimus skrjabini miyazakii TaxID=59628 RepID=A0A8S9Z2J1_9TREM|nr:hypothetical protein EG68_01328 [Paragonimus skrjabini miyazakii]